MQELKLLMTPAHQNVGLGNRLGHVGVRQVAGEVDAEREDEACYLCPQLVVDPGVGGVVVPGHKVEDRAALPKPFDAGLEA